MTALHSTDTVTAAITIIVPINGGITATIAAIITPVTIMGVVATYIPAITRIAGDIFKTIRHHIVTAVGADAADDEILSEKGSIIFQNDKTVKRLFWQS